MTPKNRPALLSRPAKSSELLRHADAQFPGFSIQAAQKPRYRVGGVAAGMHMIGATNAREVWQFYSKTENAVLGSQIIDASGWKNEFSFPWDSNLNYPTFLKISQGTPVLFFKAVQFIAAFEAYSLHKKNADIYTVMDIIPCSYNLDRFNTGLLADLRNGKLGLSPGEFDREALKATAQADPELFDRLAKGECVTKETAESLRKYVLDVLAAARQPDTLIGPVRPYPGKKKLGKGPACELEMVDTDSPKPKGATPKNETKPVKTG